MTARLVLLVLLVLSAIVLAACSQGDAPVPDEPAEPAMGEGDTVEIDVIAGDIFYQPEGVEIPPGTSLVVHFSNEGNLEHDFTTGDEGTGVLPAGESETAEIGPFDSSVTAYCTVAGHREAGMEFEITVTG